MLAANVYFARLLEYRSLLQTKTNVHYYCLFYSLFCSCYYSSASELFILFILTSGNSLLTAVILHRVLFVPCRRLYALVDSITKYLLILISTEYEHDSSVFDIGKSRV